MLIWDYWPGREGGAQRQCRKLTRALAALGVECAVLTQRYSRRAPPTEDDAGARIVRLGRLAPLFEIGLRWRARGLKPTVPWLWLGRLSFAGAAAGWLRREAPGLDALHAHESHWLGGFAAWLGAGAGLPAVCKEATYPPLPRVGRDVPLAGRWRAWRLRPHFIAQHAAAAEALAAAGVPRERLHVIPNGVELPAETARPRAGGEVLCVSNFRQGAAWKGFDVLLGAWARVARARPEARLTLLGAGDSAPWQALAQRLGCVGSVRFAGFAPDPAAYYRQAAVFVLPSRIEGLSNALLEAQSWGLPAVVSDIPGYGAAIRDGENGLTTPAGDEAALAAALLRLIGDANLRARLGAAARARAAAEFDIRRVAAATLALYRRLAEERRP